MADDETKHDEDESLRDTLASAFKSDEADDSTPVAETKEPTEATKEVEASTDKAEATEKEDSAEPTAVEPPARWTKEEKDDFSGLDPKVQQILLKRNKGLEQDYTRKTMEIAQERKRLSEIDEVFKPFSEEFQRSGMNAAQGLGMVMGYWKQANEDPMGFVKQFAADRNLDLAQFSQPTKAPDYSGPLYDENGEPLGDDVVIHPLVQKRFDEIVEHNKRLEQQVMQTSQFMQTHQQAQQSQVQAQAQSELDAFTAELDQNGQPLHPFFEDVRQDMAKLMQAGVAEDLKSAYEAAVYVRPDIRGKIEESRESLRAAAERQRAGQDAHNARLAGASLAGASSVTAPARAADDDNLSLREEIIRSFEQSKVGGRI